MKVHKKDTTLHSETHTAKFNLLPLTPKWKYTKITQQSTLLINLCIAKIIVNIGRTIHRASWCLLGGLFPLWRLYVHYLRTKWNLTQTFLEKKANFNLRVTVVDKRIPFFHYVKRSPATRKTTFINSYDQISFNKEHKSRRKRLYMEHELDRLEKCKIIKKNVK